VARLVSERFDDEGYSGANIERPGLEKLVARLQDGDIQRVIVYTLARLTRKLTDWALLVRSRGSRASRVRRRAGDARSPRCSRR
jgi:DNA invertase Pin-like site-specific DNA recombinase